MATVNADRVNIRAGQSNNYESLAEVNKGADLVVTGKSYSWYRICLPEGARMFVRSDYVKLLTIDVGEVTGDRVNIRARANTDATIIGQFVRGDQFFIRESVSGWFWIQPVAKAQGWVHQDLLVFKNRAVPVPLYPDPADAALRARAEKEALERKRLARFAALKAVADGQHEAEGTLLPESEGSGYKLAGGGTGEKYIAHVEGPPSVLGGFSGTRVVVRGTAQDDPVRNAVILNVVKISLALE